MIGVRSSRGVSVNKLLHIAASVAIACLLVLPARASDITVGLITSMTGPNASIGIPYAKGTAAGVAYKDEVDGVKIRVQQLDDSSDPTTGGRDAHKLIEEDKVDVLMGAGSTPITLAVAAYAREQKVPLISLVPLGNLAGDASSWLVSIPQPAPLMVAAVVDRMKKTGVKTVGYIGFNDAWGDLVYDALKKSTEGTDLKILTNERYARADTSVTAQALRNVAAAPDVVMTGGSGTPGALPFIALAERGYKGQIYGTHALINPDFVRVGGSAVEGVICPTGPVVVASQLPESNPIRKVALEYEAAYQKGNNEPARGAFAPYAFDGWLVLLNAAKQALAAGKTPGTAEFREALRDAMVTTKDLVGTHAVYNFTPGSVSGVDDRSHVLVQLVNGNWKLIE
jgi:branched-chain amino acid transport system substrate-binding protein